MLQNVLLNATLKNVDWQLSLLVTMHDEIKHKKFDDSKHILKKRKDENHAFKRIDESSKHMNLPHR